jgi:hypothetical protein
MIMDEIEEPFLISSEGDGESVDLVNEDDHEIDELSNSDDYEKFQLYYYSGTKKPKQTKEETVILTNKAVY